MVIMMPDIWHIQPNFNKCMLIFYIHERVSSANLVQIRSQLQLPTKARMSQCGNTSDTTNVHARGWPVEQGENCCKLVQRSFQ